MISYPGTGMSQNNGHVGNVSGVDFWGLFLRLRVLVKWNSANSGKVVEEYDGSHIGRYSYM